MTDFNIPFSETSEARRTTKKGDKIEYINNKINKLDLMNV